MLKHPPPKHLQQFHPGIILFEQYITPHFSQSMVSEYLKISTTLLSFLCKGRTSITPNLANRLSQVFDGTTVDYWLKLQGDYDVRAMKAYGLDVKCDKLTHIVKPYQPL